MISRMGKVYQPMQFLGLEINAPQQVITVRNEVVKVMFLQVCVCPQGGCGIPACLACGIPACLAAGLQGGLLPGWWCLLWRGAWSGGVPGPGGRVCTPGAVPAPGGGWYPSMH